MSERLPNLLCLLLALLGASLITATVLLRERLDPPNFSLPSFEKSRPALNDWPSGPKERAA